MVAEAPQATYHFMQPTPKVHSGFHSAWQVSGLKQQVLAFVKATCSQDRARSINVLLTGMKEIDLLSPAHLHRLQAVYMVCCKQSPAQFMLSMRFMLSMSGSPSMLQRRPGI